MQTRVPWAWMITSLIAIIDAVWLGSVHISVHLNSLVFAALTNCLFLSLSFVYTYIRPEKRLAALASISAELLAYSVSLGILSYLVVTLRYPLIDNQLSAADRFLGFDWPTVHAWVFQHKVVKWAFIAAYDSVIIQVGLLLMVMVSQRRFEKARQLLWLYIVTSLTYVIISGFWPAAGAFGYYQTALNTPYVQQFYALRAGTMTSLDLFQLQGVVQFPSFHFALAVLCTFATLGMRFLFPVFALLNLMVILATPAIGGHFLTDLWSSAIVVSVLIYAFVRSLRATGKQQAEPEVAPSLI